MENGNGNGKKIAFGEFDLQIDLEILRRGGATVHLAKRPFQVLHFLIENRGRVVSRNELLEKFWDGQDVYDDALRKCVGAIRKSLDDTEKSPRFIETRRGSGYRFIGTISEAETNGRKAESEINAKTSAPENGFSAESKVVNLKSFNGNQSEISNLKFQIADEAADFKSAEKSVQTASGETRNPHFNFRNHKIFLSVCAVVLLACAAFAFFQYRRQPQNVEARTLTETVAQKHSIAILPLKNLTGDQKNDYLSDGITESLINEISRVESLKVISRGSAFQFKDKDVSAREIGEKLGVETLLEGSLKQSSEQLRVEVRLINAKDGGVLWTSDSEQKKLSDIFAIQDGIACQIVTELKVKLCGEVAPAERYTKNVKAYQLYLQGMYFRNRLGADDLKRAVGYFEDALKVDQNYALAHEGLASTYAVMELNAIVPPNSVASKAEFHAEKALALDENLAGAYLALGAVKTMRDYDLTERKRFYRLALQKNPNHRTAHLWLANNYAVQGKFEEAEAEIVRAKEIDPLSYGVHLQLAELYLNWRKSDRAIEQANQMLALRPESDGAYGLLARAYAQKGDFEKAFAALEKIPTDNLMRVAVLVAAKRINEAGKYAESFLNSVEAKNSPYKAACVYAGLGDKEKTFASLEKAYQMRQADLVSLKIDPAFDDLRGDTRFQDLLRRVHLDE